MKILSTPCEPSPTPFNHGDVALRALHAVSQPRLHELVDDPAQADLIFLTNLKPDGFQHRLRHHPLFPRHLHKTVGISEAWNMPFLLQGIYVNATNGRDFGRFRTGSYALHHPDFKNPFIDRYHPLPDERRAPDLLFSFLGRNCWPCRDALFHQPFQRKDILVQDTSTFDAFSHTRDGKEADQRRYFEMCLRSKFILCPRGVGASSIRLFEALRLGIAPIIMSDAWKRCEGPDWERCAIFVKEADVPRLEEIVTAHEPRYQEMGRAARATHERFFAEPAYFNTLVENAVSITRRRGLPERVFYQLWPLHPLLEKIRARRSRKR